MSAMPSAAIARTLVVGLGPTGLSCVRYLHARGEPVAVTDSRADPPGLAALRAELPEVPVFAGGFAPEVFAAASRLVVSPGVPVATPPIQAARARGIPILGDIELFAQAARAPVCAITGSNGKSTVTTLVGLMARAAGWRTAVGGNLGTPALALLAPEIQLYVLELSSFQLETTDSLAPAAATVLNLSPDHLDRYATFADYGAAKARIWRQAGVAAVNRDDPAVLAMPRAVGREIGFTLGEPGPDAFGVRQDGGTAWICRGAERRMPVAEVPLAGRHNLANVLAALALAEACGLPPEPAQSAVRGFAGLPHRTVLVAERDGVSWYDDSKGTNPGATIAALEGLIPADGRGRVVLIAGGDGKGAEFAPLRPAVARAARAVVLIGRDAPRIAVALADSVPVHQAGTLEAGVRQAAALAQPGDRVLLSPACASFDQFDNYEHRGRVFAAAVRSLTP